MIGRIALVVSVCLTVLLISSCSDNSTQSGVKLGIAETEVAPIPADDTDLEDGTYSRSSDCEIIFGKTKYVDHNLHKVLAKCDSVNKYYAYIGRTESTTTLTRWMKSWCTSQHGSTTTIIDTDEQQCSSGSGTYNAAVVGYVNKYRDLLAAYNANSGGKSKSAWGERHYCNHGRAEGRTYSGLSASSCSSSTTTTTTSGSAFEGYVNKYGDLLAVFNATGGSKANWGKNHYCNHGRAEGRAYPGLSAASCSSTTTSTTTTTTSADSCYGDYVRNYPDLLAAYNARGGGQSIEAWGYAHYTNSGQYEGRSACSTTTSWPSGDYGYLCRHNECTQLSNRTRRWRSSSINIISTHSTYYTGLRGSWPVNFNLGSSGGITIEQGYGNWCGAALPLRYSDGTIRGCRMKINFLHDYLPCGSLKATVIHEVGHCIGFFRHTTDGGLMDSTANNSTGTNATTRNMISLLYSLPPGTDIGSRLRSYSRASGHKYSRTNPQKLPPKWYYTPIKD